MIIDALIAFDRELERWHDAGFQPSIWWRDDDAIKVTPQLTTLSGYSAEYNFPVMLAVIPAFIETGLADFVEKSDLLSAATHGHAHRNHADIGQKKTELTENSTGRGVDEVFEELQTAREKVKLLFGSNAANILVPPWNRISNALLPHLSSLGFELLSTFTDQKLATPINQINCQVDLMQWRPDRCGKSQTDVLNELTAILKNRREDNNPDDPIGIMSHHLVHDENAWESCQFLMRCICERPTIRVLSQSDLLAWAS